MRSPPSASGSMPSSPGTPVISRTRCGRRMPMRAQFSSSVPPARNVTSPSWPSASRSSIERARAYEKACTSDLPERRGRRHRGSDLRVSRAAADVAAHPLADLLIGRRMALTDAAHSGHDLAGGTEAALERVLVDKRLLDRMKPAVRGQPLDGSDLPPVCAGGQHHAGVHALTVQQDRAGPALAPVAALLGARQPEMLTQKVEQAGPRVAVEGVPNAVDPKADGDAGREDKTFHRVLLDCPDPCPRPRRAAQLTLGTAGEVAPATIVPTQAAGDPRPVPAAAIPRGHGQGRPRPREPGRTRGRSCREEGPTARGRPR